MWDRVAGQGPSAPEYSGGYFPKEGLLLRTAAHQHDQEGDADAHKRHILCPCQSVEGPHRALQQTEDVASVRGH